MAVSLTVALVEAAFFISLAANGSPGSTHWAARTVLPPMTVQNTPSAPSRDPASRPKTMPRGPLINYICRRRSSPRSPAGRRSIPPRLVGRHFYP